MNKVYLVYGWTPYQGDELFGAFSTDEKAEERRTTAELKREGNWENYDVEEIEVDAG